MPVIFGGNTGNVVAIRDNVSEGSISLGNVSGGTQGGIEAFGLGAAPFNSIITRIGVSAAGNYQFLHTIGNDVYVYVFGDRMGEITLHGLSFAQPCPATKKNISSADQIPAVSSDSQHGFEKLFEWYSLNRIAATPNPAQVRIGAKTTFKGFITGCTGDVADSKTRTIQFQITISLLPDDLS